MEISSELTEYEKNERELGEVELKTTDLDFDLLRQRVQYVLIGSGIRDEPLEERIVAQITRALPRLYFKFDSNHPSQATFATYVSSVAKRMALAARQRYWREHASPGAGGFEARRDRGSSPHEQAAIAEAIDFVRWACQALTRAEHQAMQARYPEFFGLASAPRTSKRIAVAVSRAKARLVSILTDRVAHIRWKEVIDVVFPNER
ncbi:MAG: hypothetical protein QM770_07550 [Tepidisphaeraceae bacterium]